MHRASRLNALRSESPPGVGPRLGRGVRSEVRDLQGRSRQAWPNRVRLRYGLPIRLGLLSTLSVENAATINYGEVTTSPIGTSTRPFNRLHRRTCRRREPPESKNGSSKAGGRHKSEVASGLVSPFGLDVRHSFQWLTPPAMDVPAFGLNRRFPRGTEQNWRKPKPKARPNV